MSLSNFTLIKAGKLIDGNGGPPIENGVVLLENIRPLIIVATQFYQCRSIAMYILLD